MAISPGSQELSNFSVRVQKSHNHLETIMALLHEDMQNPPARNLKGKTAVRTSIVREKMKSKAKMRRQFQLKNIFTFKLLV